MSKQIRIGVKATATAREEDDAPPVLAHNIAYLRTKRDRMGHDLDLPAQLAQAT